jgi:hypothetical protein
MKISDKVAGFWVDIRSPKFSITKAYWKQLTGDILMLNIKSDLRSTVNKQVLQLQKEKQKRKWLELLGLKKQSVTMC